MSGNGISDAFLIFETEVSPKYRHKGRRTISNFRARFHGLWVKSNQALGKIITREGQIISAKIIDQEIKANFKFQSALSWLMGKIKPGVR